MTVVIPFCPSDADQALSLLEFIGQLGGCQEYSALIVVDAAVDWAKCVDALTLANRAFRDARIIATETPVSGWPAGPNALWLKAAHHCKCAGTDWLWIESDAIPLKRGWLVAIDKMRNGSRYFGHIYPYREQVMNVMSGISVYPPDAIDLIGPIIEANPAKAWDVSSAEAVIPLATHTKLIHHFYGEKDLAPTFVESRNSQTPRNAFTVDQLPAEAVIYHRNKDGTLIKLLRKLHGFHADDVSNIAVVFAFCGKDAALMAKSMEWINHLHDQLPRTCVLHFDRSVPSNLLAQITMEAKRAFSTVLTSLYQEPMSPWIGWPAACNWSFREAIKFAKTHLGGPWLFFEPDAVAMKPDWLYQIEDEYEKGGKPFMGTVFPENTHMNGVGVYPTNAMEYAPCIGMVIREAWDFKCGPQIVPYAHNANRLIQHYNNGREQGPEFFTYENLNYINPTSVIYHAVKNNSLINLLMNRHA